MCRRVNKFGTETGLSPIMAIMDFASICVSGLRQVNKGSDLQLLFMREYSGKWIYGEVFEGSRSEWSCFTNSALYKKQLELDHSDAGSISTTHLLLSRGHPGMCDLLNNARNNERRLPTLQWQLPYVSRIYYVAVLFCFEGQCEYVGNLHLILNCVALLYYILKGDNLDLVAAKGTPLG